REGSITAVQTPLPKGVSMPEVIESCALESFWTRNGDWARQPLSQPSNPALRRGIGFAAGYKNVGYSFGFPEHSWAAIELHGKSEIQRVVLRANGADVGQGTHTVMMQMAADAIGVPLERVELVAS